jgi:hypothetical protein
MNNYDLLLDTFTAIDVDFYKKDLDDCYALVLFTPGIDSPRIEFRFDHNKKYIDIGVI